MCVWETHALNWAAKAIKKMVVVENETKRLAEK